MGIEDETDEVEGENKQKVVFYTQWILLGMYRNHTRKYVSKTNRNTFTSIERHRLLAMRGVRHVDGNRVAVVPANTIEAMRNILGDMMQKVALETGTEIR